MSKQTKVVEGGTYLVVWTQSPYIEAVVRVDSIHQNRKGRTVYSAVRLDNGVRKAYYSADDFHPWGDEPKKPKNGDAGPKSISNLFKW